MWFEILHLLIKKGTISLLMPQKTYQNINDTNTQLSEFKYLEVNVAKNFKVAIFSYLHSNMLVTTYLVYADKLSHLFPK